MLENMISLGAEPAAIEDHITFCRRPYKTDIGYTEKASFCNKNRIDRDFREQTSQMISKFSLTYFTFQYPNRLRLYKTQHSVYQEIFIPRDPVI